MSEHCFPYFCQSGTGSSRKRTTLSKASRRQMERSCSFRECHPELQLVHDIMGLYLQYPRCLVSVTAISMILTFQNLVINALTTMLREAPPSRPVPPQRRPMDPLRTVECADHLGHQSPCRSSLRVMYPHPGRPNRNMRGFLILTSVTVVELVLLGMSSLCEGRRPSITTVQILRIDRPSTKWSSPPVSLRNRSLALGIGCFMWAYQ